jgi:putative ABC transport system permease protein
VSDWRVAAFTAAATVVVCLLVALAPALQASRPLASTAAAPAGRWRQWVLTVQIAVASVLVLSALLIARGIGQASSGRADFALHSTSAITMRLPQEVADDRLRRRQIRAAVESALAQSDLRFGYAELVPVSELSALRTSIRPQDNAAEFRIDLQPLSARALDVLDVPLAAGRFHRDDPAAGEAVVNETLARRIWPGGNAVGSRALLNFDNRAYTIVGVVRDAHLTSLADIPPLLHIPPSTSVRPLPILLAPSSPDLRPRLTAMLSAVDPSISVSVTPLSESVLETLRTARLGATLAGGLGIIALLLAAIGVFGVFSYLVEDRRREIGIRVALGATRQQVRRAILRVCRAPVIAGVIAGLVLSAIAGAMLRGFLFGLSPLDPVSYGGVALTLLAAAMAATRVPVRRALRVDPAVTLRSE